MPTICGTKIGQFVLLEPVNVKPSHFSTDILHALPNGIFLPVSEDRDGVYYQAVNGVTIGRINPPYEQQDVAGGIYVSKTKPGLAYGYLGDARQPKEELTSMTTRLPKAALEKLRIGTPAGSRKK